MVRAAQVAHTAGLSVVPMYLVSWPWVATVDGFFGGAMFSPFWFD
jgi:hypothetical protein